MGSIYKILANSLAYRLKVALAEIISPNQSAFLEGRQAIEGVLVVNECLDEIMKKSDSGILCKLDLEKAYDKVNWVFLDYMLRRLGAGNNWHKWMKNAIVLPPLSS